MIYIKVGFLYLVRNRHRYLREIVSRYAAVVIISAIIFGVAFLRESALNFLNQAYIIVTVDDEFVDESLNTMEKEILLVSNVTKTTYSSKDEQLAIVIANYNNSPFLTDYYKDNNPLSSIIYVNIDYQFVDESIADISKISGVNSIDKVASYEEKFIEVKYIKDTCASILMFLLGILTIIIFSEYMKFIKKEDTRIIAKGVKHIFVNIISMSCLVLIIGLLLDSEFLLIVTKINILGLDNKVLSDAVMKFSVAMTCFYILTNVMSFILCGSVRSISLNKEIKKKNFKESVGGIVDERKD